MTHHEHKDHEHASHTHVTHSAETTKRKMHRGLRWALISLAVIIGLIICSCAAVAGTILLTYESKIIPRVTIGSHAFGGKTTAVTETIITEIADTLESQGVSLEINGDTIVIPGTITAEDSGGTDLVLFTINAAETTHQLFALGHSGPAYQKIAHSLSEFIYPHSQLANVTLDEEQVRAFLDSALETYETAPVNATVAVKDGKTLEIAPEKNGQTIDRDAVILALRNRIEQLNNNSISLELKETLPPLTKADIENHEEEILNLAEDGHCPWHMGTTRGNLMQLILAVGYSTQKTASQSIQKHCNNPLIAKKWGLKLNQKKVNGKSNQKTIKSQASLLSQMQLSAKKLM